VRIAIVQASSSDLQRSMRATDHVPLSDEVEDRAKAYEIVALLAASVSSSDLLKNSTIHNEQAVKRELYAIALRLNAQGKKIRTEGGRR